MNEYRITYQIDVSANSAVEAAKFAHVCMQAQDEGSFKPILDVVELHSNGLENKETFKRIDLEAIA